jgi:cytochrome b involved in lipid metabolism
LEDKAKLDRVAGGLWRIHGKAYDFSAFAAKHPGNYTFLSTAIAAVAHLTALSGGKHWVELTRGLDITDLFEVHHVNIEKATAILPKYYVQVSVAKCIRRAA